MAEASSRALWKGAINFGLVHIPVSLHSATVESGLDFSWLDKRSMDPVGYKRINKATGEEINKENIVKGIEYDEGQYVVLSEKEVVDAYPRTTQTIDIEAFVAADEIPFVYLERPYYVAPLNKGAKVYALLREILLKTGRVGVARVVIQTRQHLAALIPSGRGLVLNLLRWGDQIRPWDNLDLPLEGTKATGIQEREMKMAEQLVNDMSTKWRPDQFKDDFKQAVLKLVEQKVKAGNTESVTPLEPVETSDGSAQILDLTELLKRSLKKPAVGKADHDDEKGAQSRPKPSAGSKTAKASPAKPPSAPRKTAQPKSRAA